MSRKHNTRHSRARSQYPDRLRDRGLSHAPRLRPFTTASEQRTLRNLTHALQAHHDRCAVC